jgi:protein required for attachment to host cells
MDKNQFFSQAVGFDKSSPMTFQNTWILVFNKSEATIFSILGGINNNLKQEDYFNNEESRLDKKDFYTDKPGRLSQRIGTGRYKLDYTSNPKLDEATNFLKDIVEHIDKKHHENKFEKLILIGAPEMLGVIRKILPKKLEQNIVDEIPKNIYTKDKKENLNNIVKEEIWN